LRPGTVRSLPAEEEVEGEGEEQAEEDRGQERGVNGDRAAPEDEVAGEATDPAKEGEARAEEDHGAGERQEKPGGEEKAADRVEIIHGR
jgi:hypothetical protein